MTPAAPTAPSPPSDDAAPLVHSSFYRFVALPDPDFVAEVLRELVAPLKGAILVAEEGISGALAAPESLMSAFEQAIQHDPRLKGAFMGMPFKHSACTTAPFWKVKVRRRKEIVALGVPGVSGLPRPHDANTHVSPQQWRELIQRDDVVVLDNRNHFEYRLGRFKQAEDPAVGNFRDFPDYVQAMAPQWKAEGKRVAMYCTGGIRCEKTGSWMQSDLGLDVVQLDGGIVGYFQAMPDAERDWEGECYVFDNRVAIDTHLQEASTTIDQVYSDAPDEAWRLERAHRLDQSTRKGKGKPKAGSEQTD